MFFRCDFSDHFVFLPMHFFCNTFHFLKNHSSFHSYYNMIHRILHVYYSVLFKKHFINDNFLSSFRDWSWGTLKCENKMRLSAYSKMFYSFKRRGIFQENKISLKINKSVLIKLSLKSSIAFWGLLYKIW